MKKSALILSILSASVFAGSYAHAEDLYGSPSSDEQMQMRRKGGDYEKMGGKEMGMMGKGGMMGMHQQVVATSDGGVVIVSGGKMTKYDSSLNLVKEIELKKDKGPMAGMHEMAGGEGEEHAAPRTVRQQMAAQADVPTPQFAPAVESAPEPTVEPEVITPAEPVPTAEDPAPETPAPAETQ